MNYLGNDSGSVDWVNTAGEVVKLGLNTYATVVALQKQLNQVTDEKEKAELRLKIAELTLDNTAMQIEKEKLKKKDRAQLTKNIAIYGGAAAILTAIFLQ